MEEKAAIKSAMVSRLPKLGGRSSVGGGSTLSNGSTQPTTTAQDIKNISSGIHLNGVIHATPSSLKFKRDVGMTPSSPTTPSSPGDRGDVNTQPQLFLLGKEAKSSSPAMSKMRRSGSLTVAISSPKAIPKQSLNLSPKVRAMQGQSPLNGGPKMNHIGPHIPAQKASESCLVQPWLGSVSPRSISQDGLSQSSDNIKTLPVDNMVRSNSFTHFKQILSPTSKPMTRSFSFNRAVELAKPLANTQLRPPRSTFLKPPQLCNGRVGMGLGGNIGSSGSGGFGGLQCIRTPIGTSSLPTLSIPSAPNTPSTLRKPLLPNCVLTKSLGSSGGSLGYRPRSWQAKQQKSSFPVRVNKDIVPSATPDCVGLVGKTICDELTCETDKVDSQSDSDGSSREGGCKGGGGALLQSSGQAAGETLEDMSLSSASSLDRGDISEDFLDDINSVADVLSDAELPDNTNTGNTSQTLRRNFHNENLDWDDMDLKGHKDGSPMEDSHGPLMMSPEQSDIPDPSSVELSPSNSSDGTYMWDEDGFLPLGTPEIQACDSYDDSELNSTDILNNLYPPGTVELDDEDLMLDVDLQEDGFHDNNNMSHIERSERVGRQGPRRKHHRWSGPDHFHNDSRISSRHAAPEDKHHGYMAVVDEFTLEHMTQDCSSLKNQLRGLKSLLQLEATESAADVPEEEDLTTVSQLEELVKEVQLLRAELSNRDKTIAQLTLQCQQQQQQQWQNMHAQGRQYRCQCQLQKGPSSVRQADKQMDKRTQHHCDKATQTYWRPPANAPQILQSFNHSLCDHLHPGKPVKTPSTEGHSDLARSLPVGGIDTKTNYHLDESMGDVSRLADPDDVSERHRHGFRIPPGINIGDSPASTTQSVVVRAPAVMLQNSVTPRSPGSASPLMLQPPRLHKHVSLPALKPGGTAGFGSLKSGGSLGPVVNRTKHLPPPSRGLPCFNPGPQIQPRSLCRTSLLQPRRASERCRDPRGTNSSLEEPNQGMLKDSGPKKILIPLSRSCLPMPKIP